MSKASGMTWVLWITGFIFYCNWQIPVPTLPFASSRPVSLIWPHRPPSPICPHQAPGPLPVSALVGVIICYLGRFWFPPWTSNSHSHFAVFSRYKPNGLFLGVFPNPGLVADLVFCPIFFVSIWQVDSSGQDSHEGEWMGLRSLKSSTICLGLFTTPTQLKRQ